MTSWLRDLFGQRHRFVEEMFHVADSAPELHINGK
jgi:hypothetical protein